MMYKGHRRRIDPDARRALWEDQNRRCGYCGRKIGFSEVTVDHIIPLSRGGTGLRGKHDLFVPPV